MRVVAVKKEPKAAKCRDHYTFILTAHIIKVVARIPGRRIE